MAAYLSLISADMDVAVSRLENTDDVLKHREPKPNKNRARPPLDWNLHSQRIHQANWRFRALIVATPPLLLRADLELIPMHGQQEALCLGLTGERAGANFHSTNPGQVNFLRVRSTRALHSYHQDFLVVWNQVRRQLLWQALEAKAQVRAAKDEAMDWRRLIS
jgi:hypothetical protein